MNKGVKIAMKIVKGYAVCRYCGHEMNEGGCKKHWYMIDGQMYEAVKFGDPREQLPDDIEVCHDCGVVRGEYHHAGCDMERCPKCGSQLIGFHGCEISDTVEVEEDEEEVSE